MSREVSDEALAWLDSLQGSGIRPGLKRMRAVLRCLGNPHRRTPSIIVAGTNGKGSTSAMLASILQTAGYRTGLYTSPHLVDIRERWTIDGTMISPSALARAIERVRLAGEKAAILPTYFEALTLVAFVAFADAGCEIMVLEVGMGGRLDATNVVRPVAALITPIGFDHMEFLGGTLARIAAEKAGVIHRGTIALTSNRDERVLRVLRRRAGRFGGSLEIVGEESLPPSIEAPLHGAFQRTNAALAVRAAQELRRIFPRIDEDSIRRGLASTRWRGRLERRTVAGKEVWIDGVHNAHATAEVAPFIEANLPTPRLLVFGIMADKDVREVTRRLFPLFDHVVTTEPYPPRSVPAEELVRLAEESGIAATARPATADALRLALASSFPTIFVGGSLYLAGAAIAHLAETES